MVQNLTESVQGIQVTKGFGREREGRERFERSNQEVFDQQRSIFWSVSLFSPSVGFLTRVNMMILLGYGGWLVAHDQLPFGTGFKAKSTIALATVSSSASTPPVLR